MQDITFYPAPKSDFSTRTLEVLTHAAAGAIAKTTANTLKVSEDTIRYHLKEAKKHYCAKSTAQAVAYAIALGDIQFRVDMATEKTPAQRITAFGFIFAALITGIIDTPFLSDTDQDLARHNKVRTTRTVRVRHGRRLDLINEELIG